jgi:hypothetical protein
MERDIHGAVKGTQKRRFVWDLLWLTFSVVSLSFPQKKRIQIR